MLRAVALALIVGLLSTAIAGCGGDDSATAEQPSPGSALLVAANVGGQATQAKNMPEPCGSLPIVKRYKRVEAAATRAFRSSGLSLNEAIAVYPSWRYSTAAFFDLIAETRHRCFKRHIEELVPGKDLKFVKITSLEIPGADEGLLQRFVVSEPGGKRVAMLILSSMRVRRCVAGIVAVVHSADPRSEAVEKLSRTAARRLGAACPGLPS